MVSGYAGRAASRARRTLFGGIAAGAAGIAKIFFFVFLILFVGSALAGVSRRRGRR